MSKLFEHFVKNFQESFEDQKFRVIQSALHISNQSGFGDLVILDDEDELTLEIGNFYHQHFSSMNPKDFEESKIIELLKKILKDEVIIQSTYAGSVLLESKLISLEDGNVLGIVGYLIPKLSNFFRKKTYKKITWSGNQV